MRIPYDRDVRVVDEADEGACILKKLIVAIDQLQRKSASS